MINHSRQLYTPLCVIFVPDSGYIARYVPFIWHRSPTNCDAYLTESIFQTRSDTRKIQGRSCPARTKQSVQGIFMP